MAWGGNGRDIHITYGDMIAVFKKDVRGERVHNATHFYCHISAVIGKSAVKGADINLCASQVLKLLHRPYVVIVSVGEKYAFNLQVLAVAIVFYLFCICAYVNNKSNAVFGNDVAVCEKLAYSDSFDFGHLYTSITPLRLRILPIKSSTSFALLMRTEMTVSAVPCALSVLMVALVIEIFAAAMYAVI